ncbi:MAG TPA: lycopene cyclase domain-containing protein [Pseudonocardiaceae bacterium]
MAGEYTILALLAAVLVVLVELLVLRTGLFRRPAYWLSLPVLFAFQVPVDGWLTKLSAPIVSYAPWATSGARVPWDIPVEDFVFGFALVTWTLLLWERAAGREGAGGRRP